MDALYAQIREAMTPEQIKAIDAMDFTEAEITEMKSSLGVGLEVASVDTAGTSAHREDRLVLQRMAWVLRRMQPGCRRGWMQTGFHPRRMVPATLRRPPVLPLRCRPAAMYFSNH